MESIIVALITGVLSLVGVVITNTAAARRTENKITTAQAVTDTKLDELTREVRAAAQKNLKRSLKQRTPERMPRPAARMKRTSALTQLSSARMLRTENCWILRRMLRASNVVSTLSFLCILFH